MSTNEYGRETHWQLVKSDSDKPWHARMVSNYRVILYSPQYRHRRDALRAIELASPEWLASKTPLEVDERAKDDLCECGHPEINHNSFGCLVYYDGAGFCACGHFGTTEGNSTNGPEPVVVDG